MKQVNILIALCLLTLLTACVQPTNTGTETTQAVPRSSNSETAQQPSSKYEVVQLAFIADRSKSFVRHYDFPSPSLFKPLLDKVVASGVTLDFRYGVIREYSDITFDRYYVPYVTESSNTPSNPWLNIDKKKAPIAKSTNWNEFAAAVNTKLVAPPSDGSDVASAISHAIVSFQECSKKTRKILFLCTDAEDTYRQLPTIPQDVEVITVGILPDNHIEQTLNTNNVKRFENLNAAIDYLFSQNF